MRQSNGALLNPLINVILAEVSGFVEGEGRAPSFIVSSTVAAVVVFEWRNAANDGNLWSHIFPIAANQPLCIKFPEGESVTATGERARLRLNAAITGSIQGTLWS